MSLLELQGEIISIGDLAEEDAPKIIGVPHVLIRIEGQSGRTVLLTGLTRDECRACAEAFAEQISLAIGRT